MLAGGVHGDGLPGTGPDAYYDLLGLPAGRPFGGGPVRVTDAGVGAGLRPSLGDCCTPANSFVEPAADSPLTVLERDGSGAPVTLAGDGISFGGRLVDEPVALPTTGASTSTGCASRRHFAIHVRRLPGVRYASVRIGLPNRPDIVLRGGAIKGVVDLRGLPKGRWTIHITVTTTGGASFTGIRRYRTCGTIAYPGGRHRL